MHLDQALAAALAVAGVGTLVFAHRIGDTILLAQAAAGVAVTAALVASAWTAGGTLLSCAGFLWVALWVALFFPPRHLAAALGLEVASVLVASCAGAHPGRILAAGASVVAVAAVSSATLARVVGGLRRLAVSDQLTGLLNRHGVDLALAGLEHHADRPVSLVAIDLDGLKTVNDRHGHDAGDRVLARFADELSAAVRSADVAARIGGDEFLAILLGATAAQARRWADNFRRGSRLSWSFGIAERRRDEPFQVWFGRADDDLYRAKPRSAAPPRSA